MLVRLNYNKILRVDHHDLILEFIKCQIKQFDHFHKKAAKYTVNDETVNQDDPSDPNDPNDPNDPSGSRHTHWGQGVVS